MELLVCLLVLLTPAFVVSDGNKNINEVDITKLLEEIAEIRNNQRECSAKVERLEKIVSRLEKVEEELEALKRKQEEITTTKSDDADDQRSDDTGIHHEMPSKSNEVLPEVIIKQQRGIDTKRQVSSLQVAFSAGISVPTLDNLGIHHTILFDKVLINIGNAFHDHTGVFIAPYDGVYVFHLVAMGEPTFPIYLGLMKDGALMTSIYVDAPQGHRDSDSKIWILQLATGNEVFISTGNAGKIHGNMYTVFSGWLLYGNE